MLSKIVAADGQFLFFLFFLENDTAVHVNHLQMIHMIEMQGIIFSEKNTKKKK